MSSDEFSLYTTEDPQWRKAARHLSKLEDTIMRMKRDGRMKAIEASEWINANIRPLERQYEKKGPTDALLEKILALSAPA
jgi:hypothetical protein